MLKFENIRKSFGDNVAVDDFSIDIAQGEIFGLLGPNGAGKTTIINMAVGLLNPDKGSVVLDGQAVRNNPSLRSRIGVAPQALALYEELSAEENLTFFGKIQHLTGKELAERTNWTLDFVGLTDRRKDRVKTFSGGMKRRLNLAVALIHDPPVLLLDEPTVGVDPQSRNSIFDNIESLQEQKRTIIYTTHYMEEAQRLCHRVGIIDHGKLLALDTVDNLLEIHGGKDVVIIQQDEGEKRIETDDAIEELLRLKKEGSIQHFRVETPNLEAVFLNLTGRHLRD